MSLGMARALGMAPETLPDEDAAFLLLEMAQHLLKTLEWEGWEERYGAHASAHALFRLRWPWAGLQAVSSTFLRL